ncbi:unnamed protein product [Triticum turgidum subsp. durum]|uniref:KIB1-4 beta-propeller domain-containing protein n=1 Tax=Triticum turgidum subsp. durum TaxID=4567 RepID=A0A9R1RV17_TRITD|nr:unnamed protein product [Triticum turgidum subsp. durum]
MPADLVELIGWLVLAGDDLRGYVRFRSVCTHVRSSTPCPRANGIAIPRFHPRRWTMLPEGHDLHLEDGRMRFLNLDTGAFVRPRLPLLDDHRIICPVDGLLLLQRHRQHDNENGDDLCLLHPFTGTVAKFPPITYVTMSLGSIHWSSRMERPYLSPGRMTASLSIRAVRVPMLMIVLLDLSRVVFATTNDKQWSFSAWTFSLDNSIITSSQGKFYMLQKPASSSTNEPRIFQIDPPRHEKTSGFSTTSFQPPEVIAICPKGKIHTPFELIECDSEILLVGSSSEHSKRMVVYNVADLVLGRVVPLKSIGGNALLIDIASSETVIRRSLSVGFKVVPTITGDTIVRRDPTRYRCLEQYHLGNGTWSSRAVVCAKHDVHGRCTCGLINHMYGVCHCFCY